MKFWSILIQISVTNFVLPTSSEVTPSNSTQFDRLENLLDAVDSKVEREDYYEDDYGLVFFHQIGATYQYATKFDIFSNYETEVRASIPDEEYPRPVLTES